MPWIPLVSDVSWNRTYGVQMKMVGQDKRSNDIERVFFQRFAQDSLTMPKESLVSLVHSFTAHVRTKVNCLSRQNKVSLFDSAKKNLSPFLLHEYERLLYSLALFHIRLLSVHLSSLSQNWGSFLQSMDTFLVEEKEDTCLQLCRPLVSVSSLWSVGVIKKVPCLEEKDAFQ